MYISQSSRRLLRRDRVDILRRERVDTNAWTRQGRLLVGIYYPTAVTEENAVTRAGGNSENFFFYSLDWYRRVEA